MSDFNGTWTIDLESSTVWDAEKQRHVPDRVGYELITLRDEGGVQDYEVLYGDAPTFRMGYTSRYDDPQWVPYEVREITNIPQEGLEKATAIFKERINAASGDGKRSLEMGKAYSLVRVVSGDRRTHYRLARDPASGGVMYVMPRRLAQDGKSYVATVLNSDGIVFRVRRFIRVN